MSWKEKMKEFGGGDVVFMSVDGETLKFIVVGEPLLLTGKYKGQPTERIGCPVITEDGFELFITGKRLARKIAKFEGTFETSGFIAIRHGEQGDINAVYELKVLDDFDLLSKLQAYRDTEFKTEMISEAIIAAKEIMQS